MTTKIIFTLPAAENTGEADCVLLGEFNNWDTAAGIALQKQADGSMTAEVELVAGSDYQYRYLLSNGRWVNDDGEKIISNLSGYPVENCIVRVRAFTKKTKTVKTKTSINPKSVIVKEDLTKVEGIGKKIEALLYKNKIYNYQQLSKSTIKKLKAILETGGRTYSMHDPGSWPKQAKLASNAQWKELEIWQKQLKGGQSGRL